MRRHLSKATVLVVVGLVVAACAPGPASPQALQGGEPAAQSGPKTLTIALEGEPFNLVLQLGGASGVGSVSGSDLYLAVHQRLASYDERGGVHAMLASELPSQGQGSWIVRADGTMQTTYKLRPNVLWHDGTPLTPRDFVFAWTVTTDPEIPTDKRTVSSQISRIDVPDPLTLVMEWTNRYPFAHALVVEDLGPLPAHLLEAAYRSDRDAFVNLSFWTREFVGVGPYRLAEWEPGSHLVLRAFDRFYAGRAKIDTLVIRFISDSNTVVANLLAGTVDGEIPRALDFAQAMFVAREWERLGRNPQLIVQPTHWRFVFVQFRDPRPRELLDVRVRRGMLHAVDRQALIDALLEGRTWVSHTLVAPNDQKWDWVKDVVTRYDFSSRRAEELFAEAGWRRGADGGSLTASGENVALSVWSGTGQQDRQELSILADYWKAAGITVDQQTLPPAQARDLRTRASFPAINPSGRPLRFENLSSLFYSPACPTEQNRWVGDSSGCYQNPAVDRAIDGLKVTIDPGDQQSLWRDLVRLQSQDLPVLPLYFNVKATLYREGVTGVKGDTVPSTHATWNVAEWDVP